MAAGKEKWTRLGDGAKLELPRGVKRADEVYVSPAGIFVPGEIPLEPGQTLIARLKRGDKTIVAHAEMRRLLEPHQAAERGIPEEVAGCELRIVRMEGDGSQVLADHIKKMLLESGGPA
ncbi:MAG: hypothetical protein D6806_09845 [Deltaproteobacteria bacterium]|nr:MAG: hypothetical protein D6806_09845 [Deltaproteobacteria bacterium]